MQKAIPGYLEVYWAKFHVLYPIVHRPTCETAADDATHLLRYAMAAVATQFMEGREHRINGLQLHDFAWKEVNRVCLLFSLLCDCFW